MLLSGKTAIISGAAGPRGIGFAAARLFAEHGARVAILDIDQKAAEAAAKGLGFGPSRPRLRRDRSGRVQAGGREIIARFGQIDVLVNNAGITQPVKFMEIDQVSWRRIIEVNLTGVLNLSQAVVPHMRERKIGIHRLHVVSVCTARRRNLRRSRITRRRRQAFWGSPRQWRANSGRTIFASTA